MAVIAMTREMGSLGKDVAAGLADQMGLTVVHHELVEHHLAERLGVKESTVHRYLEGEASLLERWKIDKQELSRYTAEEILELAGKGNVVIRGWGATGVLRHIPHVLRVRVCADMGSRERVITERLGLTDATVARREIERSDAAHTSTMRSFFGVDWQNPLLYHLVLNTASVPIETCVKIVRLLAERPEFQETEETRSVLADKLVESRVRAALGDAFSTPITIGVAKGKVTLTGTTMGPIANVEELVRGIPGVTEVENRIVIVRSSAV
jgi:cytidylate kinase